MSFRSCFSLGKVRRISLAIAITLVCAAGLAAQSEVQFVFTSDPHYGLVKKSFRGAKDVDAHQVNAFLVAKLNTLSAASFANDGGINAGKVVGAIDFVAEGGDIANRQEGTKDKGIQSASVSWSQFKADYIDGIALKNRKGDASPLFIIPGNHDLTDALGFYKPMYPATDATAMAEIYNLAMKPAVRRTKDSYDFSKDKIHYSVDMGGVHLIFISIWPDSAERAWMEADLKTVSSSTPVILFSHDESEVEAKHFSNPNGSFDINGRDKFENLLADKLADGAAITAPTTIEQRDLEAFFKAHSNISVYFHGNDHWKRFSDWTGPDNTALIHTFGVDSPMKGTASADDETKLSFYVVTVDSSRRLMTVRDCLYDAKPADTAAGLAWGETITVAINPRPAK